MNQHRLDEEGLNDLCCGSQYVADLLIRKHEGILSEDKDRALQAHLDDCKECQIDYQSLRELDMDMLIAANDDQRLHEFNPDPAGAETCLLTTWDRLTRFATGTSENEFVSDEELESHIDECIYCRRRSIIAHRRVRFPNHLPLAYRLSEEAVREAIDIAAGRVWEFVSSEIELPELLGANRGASQLTPPQQNTAKKVNTSLRLKSGVRITVGVDDADVFTIELENLPDTEKRRVLLIGSNQTEHDATTDVNGHATFSDLPDGEYCLRIERAEELLIVALKAKTASVRTQ